MIILTTFGRPGYLRRAMEAGAVGFMVKDDPADQLIEGIRRVHRGLRVVDPALAADSLSLGASPLTERETEVLAAAASTLRPERLRQRCYLSEGTVRNHLSAAMSKLGAATRAKAVRMATENGWPLNPAGRSGSSPVVEMSLLILVVDTGGRWDEVPCW